ncbi:hypothetical protein AAIB41_17790 [Brucella sp. BE17]|uniref:hypothetical protein n=1 Tax=Brucella sp. BE17 TaxID=3142977 RepID=UPI0031BA8060
MTFQLGKGCVSHGLGALLCSRIMGWPVMICILKAQHEIISAKAKKATHADKAKNDPLVSTIKASLKGHLSTSLLVEIKP